MAKGDIHFVKGGLSREKWIVLQGKIIKEQRILSHKSKLNQNALKEVQVSFKSLQRVGCHIRGKTVQHNIPLKRREKK